MVTLPFLSQPGIAKTGTRGLDCQHETNEVVTTRALGHTHTHPWESEAVGEGGRETRVGWQGRDGQREGTGQVRAMLPSLSGEEAAVPAQLPRSRLSVRGTQKWESHEIVKRFLF